MFYASSKNGKHAATGTEFFTSSSREGAINMLAGLSVHPDNDATGIENREQRKYNNGQCYDLQGRRLNAMPTRRGVYIVDGHKVMVR